MNPKIVLSVVFGLIVNTWCLQATAQPRCRDSLNASGRAKQVAEKVSNHIGRLQSLNLRKPHFTDSAHRAEIQTPTKVV
jgi:hypothetical protein